MEDQEIIALYVRRSEKAVAETDAKYGSYCRSIAERILANREDAEETVNDTYFAAWNTIPPQIPPLLAAFLGKITRNLSIDRRRFQNAKKRGGGEWTVCLEELADCVSGESCLEQEKIMEETAAALNRFLKSQTETDRKLFLFRYWHLHSVREIASACGMSQSNVTTRLYRTRRKLRRQLEREGLI